MSDFGSHTAGEFDPGDPVRMLFLRAAISSLKQLQFQPLLGSLAQLYWADADWPAENGAILANGERPLSFSG
jgi:hypothetical protein